MQRLALIAALTLTATACTSPQPTMQPGTPAAPSVTSSAPTTKASGLVGKVGDTYTGVKADVTVEQFNGRVTSQYSTKVWQAALVKTCAKEDNLKVGLLAWSVTDDKSGRWQLASESYDDAPKPAYPVESPPLALGECVRGWALFDASPDTKAVEVRYAPDGSAGARWKVA